MENATFINRQNKIKYYQSESQRIDAEAREGVLTEKVLDELEKLRRDAESADADVCDYQWFFESEKLAYSDKHEYAKAIDRLSTGIKWAEEHGFEADPFLLRNLGSYYLLQENYDESIKYFERVLSTNSQDGIAMRRKGTALLERGEEETAIVWFDNALRINPQDTDAMQQKGVALSKIGDENTAIACFKQVLELDSKHGPAMRSMGVSLLKTGQEKDALKCLKQAASMRPCDEMEVRHEGVALYYMGIALYCDGKKDEAVDLLCQAAIKRPRHWLSDFFTICKLTDKDPRAVWKKFSPDKVMPKGLENKNHAAELRFMIFTIRGRIGKQANRYLAMKKTEEERMDEFLKPESRFLQDQSLLMVLRKWNSYTPALPVSLDDERSRGGGYFIWHNGCGTVIDPGFNFIENFHQAGGRIHDIHNIILTHAHTDHTAEFETLRTLLFEYNENIKEKNISRNEQGLPLYERKKVRFFLNNGCFRKFAGMIDLKDPDKITEKIITLNRGAKLNLLGGGEIQVLPAYHDELLSLDQSVGLFFKLETASGVRRILLTSDTGQFPLDPKSPKPSADDSNPESEIAKQYTEVVAPGDIDIMLVHIGSIKPQEFDVTKKRIAEICYANHLGIIGTAQVITMCQPKLAVISEFGEEMRNFRYELIKDLRETILPLHAVSKGKNAHRTAVVPGDLAFVYNIGGHKILDCCEHNWCPADRIDFWEHKGANNQYSIYYAGEIPEKKKEKLVKSFIEARSHYRGLYFKTSDKAL